MPYLDIQDIFKIFLNICYALNPWEHVIEYQNTNEKNQIRYFLKNIFWSKYFQ